MNTPWYPQNTIRGAPVLACGTHPSRPGQKTDARREAHTSSAAVVAPVVLANVCSPTHVYLGNFLTVLWLVTTTRNDAAPSVVSHRLHHDSRARTYFGTASKEVPVHKKGRGRRIWLAKEEAAARKHRRVTATMWNAIGSKVRPILSEFVCTYFKCFRPFIHFTCSQCTALGCRSAFSSVMVRLAAVHATNVPPAWSCCCSWPMSIRPGACCTQQTYHELVLSFSNNCAAAAASTEVAVSCLGAGLHNTSSCRVPLVAAVS